MSKKKNLANYFFCSKDKVCDFDIMVGKKEYPCCVGCVREARKDGYAVTEHTG